MRDTLDINLSRLPGTDKENKAWKIVRGIYVLLVVSIFALNLLLATKEILFLQKITDVLTILAGSICFVYFAIVKIGSACQEALQADIAVELRRCMKGIRERYSRLKQNDIPCLERGSN